MWLGCNTHKSIRLVSGPQVRDRVTVRTRCQRLLSTPGRLQITPTRAMGQSGTSQGPVMFRNVLRVVTDLATDLFHDPEYSEIASTGIAR